MQFGINKAHIGTLIKRTVEKSGMSVSNLAKKIDCNRSNIYSIYERKSIDIDLLIRISKVLEHDLISDYLNLTASGHLPVTVNNQNRNVKILMEIPKEETQNSQLAEIVCKYCVFGNGG